MGYYSAMDDLKTIVGKNLNSLRKQAKLTQNELAEKFNYTDKAVSKWEQGATLPDLETLKQLADFYGVTIDYLTEEKNIKNPQYNPKAERIVFINRVTITCLLSSIIWMIATITFIYPLLFMNSSSSYWPIFVWALPANSILVLVLNRIFFHKSKTIMLVAATVFIWTLLTAFYLHFSFFSNIGYNLWLIYLIGVPTQAVIVLVYMLRKNKH